MRYGAGIFEALENAPCVVQVFVRLIASVDLVVEKAQIVYNAGEIAFVPCLFKVITRGCVLNQSAVNVISSFL